MATTEALLPSDGYASKATVAKQFLVLGCTAFGGPPVHIGMYRESFVQRQGWMSEDRFAELFAMANCLPGPSSTQVAFAIGITQQGTIGGLLAGFCFILPSFIFLLILGFVANAVKDQVAEKGSSANYVAVACSSVGVALIFIAVSGLVKKQVFDKKDDVWKLGMICCGTAAVCLAAMPPPAWLNPVLILTGGIITVLFPVSSAQNVKAAESTGRVGLNIAAGSAIFVLYLLAAAFTIYMDAALSSKDPDERGAAGWMMPFLTAGMFVWGGGPVVLPMLMTYLTPAYIEQTIFLTGIAVAEMMPGPVFNLSAFLGVQLALANSWPWALGTILCWMGLSGPGILLIFGAMPLCDKLREFQFYQRALPGLNSAAVGLLVSTIFLVYNTLQERTPWQAGSNVAVLLAYCAVEMVKVNVPLTVVVAGLIGFGVSFIMPH